jgi:hypothetical protein
LISFQLAGLFDFRHRRVQTGQLVGFDNRIFAIIIGASAIQEVAR